MASDKKRSPPPPAPDTLPRGIGAPATRALASIGIDRLGPLRSLPDSDLLALHGFGPKALRLVREALASLPETPGNRVQRTSRVRSK